MEVHVTPETAKKLKDLSATSGRAPEDIIEDALAGYLEELASVRKTLDSRYDDLKSGRVKPIDDEEASRRCAKRASADDRADERLRLPSGCVRRSRRDLGIHRAEQR
jgi:predicted transcriptional regulator